MERSAQRRERWRVAFRRIADGVSRAVPVVARSEKSGPTAPPTGGPAGHRNWRCFDQELPIDDTVEIALYSDAHLVAHGEFGPYQVINTIPTDRQERLPMAAVLRMQWRIPESNRLPDMSRSDQSTFHGGGLPDEIAALISLALGARVQAGGVVREFPEDDPRGTPVQHGHRRPDLPAARQESIPNLRATKDLRTLSNALLMYPRVAPDRAIEVVRAARSYQQGVWMSDADPEYAWLKFVSALETAANCWWRGDNDPAAALRQSKPDLAELLELRGDEELVRAVSEILKDQLRATHRFHAFMERYRPDPPSDRPPPAFQTDWGLLPVALRLIYSYRSKSLHAGKPFPAPMLDQPAQLDEGQCPAEKPLGLAAAVGSAVWQAAEMPMLLHVFEYVTRTALLSWFRDTTDGPAA